MTCDMWDSVWVNVLSDIYWHNFLTPNWENMIHYDPLIHNFLPHRWRNKTKTKDMCWVTFQTDYKQTVTNSTRTRKHKIHQDVSWNTLPVGLLIQRHCFVLPCSSPQVCEMFGQLWRRSHQKTNFPKRALDPALRWKRFWNPKTKVCTIFNNPPATQP